MKRHNQKKFIAFLLFISCIAGGWLLFISPAAPQKQLQSTAQADSLLEITLSDFNIADQLRSTHISPIDSSFSRKTYTVAVSPSFSKTQFHAVLQHRFSPYQISLPARVIFPDKDMHIHFEFENTIFRSLKLITDEDLHLQRNFASIVVAFDGRPPDYLLDKLISFGEPIPIAIIQKPPLNEPDWWDNLQKKYPNVYIWPKTTAGKNMLADDQQMISKINHLEESMPSATLLSFYNDKNRLSAARQQTSSSFIAVQDAILFNEEMEKSEFNQTFRTFVEQAREGKNPVGIIMGTEQTLAWAHSELNIYKKGGLFLKPPSKHGF